METSLIVQINGAESHIRRLRSYWGAVADDLGPLVWEQPTNMYRQIWEQEIFAADCKFEYLKGQLEQLKDQNRKKALEASARVNEDPYRLLDITGTSSLRDDTHTSQHHLEDQLGTLAPHEAPASNKKKRTLKRKLGRKRAKARRLNPGTNPSVDQSSLNSPHYLDTNQKLVAVDRNCPKY